jgi:hypothetical protein
MNERLGAILDVRDFLMRAAIYQSTEFSRDEVRREARKLLHTLDGWLRGHAALVDPPQGEQPVNQGEKAVNQTFRPNYTQYFPQLNGHTPRKRGRPKKVLVS